MFAPAASTKRSVCLVAFALVCVLPTLYVAYTALTIHLPVHAADIAAELSDRLNLDVELGSVAYPRPGVVEYRDLLLLDPETRRRLARIDRLRLTGDEAHLKLTAATARLYCDRRSGTSEGTASSLQTSRGSATQTKPSAAADLGAIGKAFETILSRIERSSLAKVTFDCPELDVDLAGKRHRLTRVVADYSRETAGAETKVQFRLARLQQASKSEVEIRRDRYDGRATTHVVLRTGPTPLPLSLLEPYFDTAGWLGPQSRFQGTFWFDETDAGWVGAAEGVLEMVDFRYAVTRHFPHRLSGIAQLQIDQLRWADGRIQQLVGSLRAGPGWVGAELLQSLAQHVGFELGEAVLPDKEIFYRRLAFGFAMEAGQLDVAGRCNTPTGGAVMVVGDTVLLRQPPHPSEVAGLIRALVPPIGVAIPVNHESQTLMRLLPVPGTRRSQTSNRRAHPDAAVQHPPARLRPRQAEEMPSPEPGIKLLPPHRVIEPK